MNDAALAAAAEEFYAELRVTASKHTDELPNAFTVCSTGLCYGRAERVVGVVAPFCPKCMKQPGSGRGR